jgi:hypothetical protein
MGKIKERPAGALKAAKGTPAAKRPRRIIDAALRGRIEKAVETLIAALDLTEADPDLEENGDSDADHSDEEPTLGSFDRMTDQGKSWRQHEGPGRAWGADDVEQDDCDREDNGDREPDDSGIGDDGGLAEQIGGVV